jgi:hypothetical protein
MTSARQSTAYNRSEDSQECHGIGFARINLPKLPRSTSMEAERALLAAGASNSSVQKGSHRIYGKGDRRVNRAVSTAVQTCTQRS